MIILLNILNCMENYTHGFKVFLESFYSFILFAIFTVTHYTNIGEVASLKNHPILVVKSETKLSW